jgi:hypothetical protein|tara:strand:+ start:74 stop:709 length:636 start_codon:yes stop_codon:yes gene_type:complete
MRPKQFTLTPQSDADGICASQTPSASGEQSLTIAGALASGGSVTLNQGHLIQVTAAGNETGRDFTITGTDYRGNTISEVVEDPNAGAVSTTKYFKTVTSVTVDDDTAGAITVGVNGQSSSNTIPLDRYQTPFNVGIGIDISNTLTYTVQHTFDNVQIDTSLDALKWFNHDDLAAQTADADGNYAFNVEAVRIIITSFTSGTLTGTLIQSGV